MQRFREKLAYATKLTEIKEYYYRDCQVCILYDTPKTLQVLEIEQEYHKGYQNFCDIIPRPHIDDHQFVKGLTENTIEMCSYTKNNKYCHRHKSLHIKI